MTRARCVLRRTPSGPARSAGPDGRDAPPPRPARSTDTHAQIIEEAAAAGKHIFCEKPIDHDLGRIDRALAADPKILVLDDALSAVDTQTEEEILAGLRAERGQRTSFVIAHRLSTVRDADLIVVLDGGRIVERGSHDELMAAGGRYRQLYDLQARSVDEGAAGGAKS